MSHFLIACPLKNVDDFFFYCGIRLRGQNDKNLAICGHFRKVRPSKRKKQGVKIVVRKKIVVKK